MSDGEYLDSIRQVDEDHVVREPWHADSANILILGGRYHGTGCRSRLDSGKHGFHRRYQFIAKAGPLRLVPGRGFRELAGNLPRNADRLQGFPRRVFTWSRTSGHERPGSAPVLASAARRSISAAQAASASASGSPSRLAINSAANSARSPGARSSASRKSSFAALVTGRMVPPERAANKRLQRSAGPEPCLFKEWSTSMVKTPRPLSRRDVSQRRRKLSRGSDA